MKNIAVSIFICSTLILLGLWPQAFAQEQASTVDAKQLFENKCSFCHSLDRPRSKKMSKQGWESTVMRMKNTNGAPMSDEEAGIIIDYLAKEYGE